MTARCQVPGLQRRDSQRVQSRRGDRNSDLILWCDMDICKYVKNMEGAWKKKVIVNFSVPKSSCAKKYSVLYTLNGSLFSFILFWSPQFTFPIISSSSSYIYIDIDIDIDRYIDIDIYRRPWWLNAKEPTCRCRRYGFDPWVRKIPGEGNSNPLQSMGWQKSWSWLSD